MRSSRHKLIALAGAVALAFGLWANGAQASFVINALVGGAPTGINYANFNNLPFGSAGGTSGGISVSYLPDGKTATGSTSGINAAPYISNSNGVLFGDSTVAGSDTTPYLSTGLGSATLYFPGQEAYLGLLWGSVDAYNTLSFYNGAALVGSITGTDITALANGNQGASGTYYVNITSSLDFDHVVATSSQYAFELDNVAYNTRTPVPEPISLGLLGLGVMGLGLMRRRKTPV